MERMNTLPERVRAKFNAFMKLPPREQAAIVVTLLRDAGTLNFRELVAGVAQSGIVVARFLAVLELYRHAALSFEQLEPLGELTLRWTAERWSEENLATLGADYDR